jgi:hypothetical protein
VDEILKRIERLQGITTELISQNPTILALRVMLPSFEELKQVLEKPELDKAQIRQINYGILKVYQEMLSFENTPFGDEVGKLLLDLSQLGYGK